MIYPKSFEEKTGFNHIRHMLKELCLSELGQKQVERMRFRRKIDLISKLLDQTDDFRKVILSGETFPQSNYYDPAELFKKIRPENTYILPEELAELWLSLTTINKIIDYFKKTDKDEQPLYPSLYALTEGVYLDKEIFEEIEKIIDESGEIRDNASRVLADIRKQKASNHTKAKQQINHILKDVKKKGWISDDLELTIRNGRQVIPVPATHKKYIRGFIHDSSSTGQTVFIEPEEVFEINNEIRELELAEWKEVVRILTNFTDFLRPYIELLKKCYRLMGIADLIRAKALLAVEMGGMRPKLTPEPAINWVKAVHPLLYLSYKKQNKHVEPFDLELEKDHRILMISGPNAGGKSVCLKACGLIQYMLQCGMLVPMTDYSEAGVFQKLFIDIGDEQSLENDLSTYSSHLYNLKFFLKHANNKTLFLIDEFGSGTEPRIGGAIAESALMKLNDFNPFGVITTHYSNLKAMGGKVPGIISGSMLFDSKNMKPVYKLKTGVPGSSFAFEIAKSIGFPNKILEKASEIAGKEQVNLDHQLQNLELRKQELEEKEKQLRSAETFLNEMIEKYQRLSEELKTRKNEMLADAKNEAKQILSETNKKIENTIKEIRESNADKENTKRLRKELNEYTKQLEKNIPEKPKTKPARDKPAKEKPEYEDVQDSSPVKKGDMVRMEGQNFTGEVVDISGNQGIVLFGDIKIRAPLKKLQKVKFKKNKQVKTNSGNKVKYSFDINKKAAEFNTDIDLRGKKVDEALSILRRYIDDAVLLGIKKIRILHGKGEGVLRDAIKDYLMTVPEVENTKPEHPDRGGDGITQVFFSY